MPIRQTDDFVIGQNVYSDRVFFILCFFLIPLFTCLPHLFDIVSHLLYSPFASIQTVQSTLSRNAFDVLSFFSVSFLYFHISLSFVLSNHFINVYEFRLQCTLEVILNIVYTLCVHIQFMCQ